MFYLIYIDPSYMNNRNLLTSRFSFNTQKHKCNNFDFLIQLPVITVVVRNASMHSVTNFFILNLAISDVIMCMVAVPFTPLMSFAGRITDHTENSGEVIFQYLCEKS